MSDRRSEPTDIPSGGPPDDEWLLILAAKARAEAYAPYSRLAVGAAVLASSGRAYTGCNVENASFGLTTCAERVAIFSAVAAGEREIVSIAVSSTGDSPAYPCGACLQVAQEFSPGPRTTTEPAAHDLTFILEGPERRPLRVALHALLPQPFRFTRTD